MGLSPIFITAYSGIRIINIIERYFSIPLPTWASCLRFGLFTGYTALNIYSNWKAIYKKNFDILFPYFSLKATKGFSIPIEPHIPEINNILENHYKKQE